MASASRITSWHVLLLLAACSGGGQRTPEQVHAEILRKLPVTLHDCTGPIVYAASCALSMTLPNANYQEAVRAYFTGWYKEIVAELPPVINGSVSSLEGPGLGLSLRPELFQRPDATVRITRA